MLGFGGIVERSAVKKGADWFIKDFKVLQFTFTYYNWTQYTYIGNISGDIIISAESRFLTVFDISLEYFRFFIISPALIFRLISC